MLSLTTTRPTNTPRCANGLPDIGAGPSTSHQPRPPGSMPSRPSSQSSRVGASSAASFDPSTNSRPLSTASSPRQTPIQSRSSGPLIPSASSPLSNAGKERQSHSTRRLHRFLSKLHSSSCLCSAEAVGRGQAPHRRYYELGPDQPDRMLAISLGSLNPDQSLRGPPGNTAASHRDHQD